MKIFRPRRQAPEQSYVEELEQSDAESGMIRRHVTWTQDVPSAEDQARIILDAHWKKDRGHAPAINDLDGFDLKSTYRRFKAMLYRGLDRLFGIRSPYEK